MNFKLLRLAFLCAGVMAPLSVYCAPLEVLTEDYPPFSMMNDDNQISGLSTEIVEALFKRAGVEYNISLLTWKRAYARTRNTANTALYSTTRTPEREALFKWVGPLVKNHWAFFARHDSALSVASLNDAKQYSAGGYNGDAVARYLWTQGFEKLQLADSERDNLQLLASGKIKLWATGEYLGPYLARQEHVVAPKLLWTFREAQMSLAFNKSAPDELIKKLNDTLEEMRKDGVIDAISAKYR